MTYARKAHERATRYYREVLYELRSRIPGEFLLKDSLIRAEFLKRDFTKRQMNIITFIFGLSLDCGKDRAIVPKLVDWQLCGVGQNKIKDELEKLVEMNVINWNTEDNTFAILPTIEWEAPYHYGFIDKRMQEIFNINIIDAGIDVTEIAKRVQEEGL